MSGLKETDIQDSLGCTFVKALAQYEGYSAFGPDKDIGTDVYIERVTSRTEPSGGRRFFGDGTQLQIQIKTVLEHKVSINQTNVIYDLEAKNYNDLIYRKVNNSPIPLVLIVVILPSSKQNWLEIQQDVLMLRKHAYWYEPNSTTPTGNSTSQRINIPIENKLSIDSISKLYEERMPNGTTQ